MCMPSDFSFCHIFGFSEGVYKDIVMYMYACICIQSRESGGMFLQKILNRRSEIASGAILEQK